MNSSTAKQHVPFILLILSFAVYMKTICPVVYLGDSGELTAAAFSLGIPHGSGYPLYCLLGKLFCLIPLGNIGFRMNLMSTCFAVVTLWLIYSFIFRITSSRMSALVGALFLAFTPFFWSQSVPAEVYTLHTFFVALLVRLLWWWDETRKFSHLILFVFITGISFGNHMQTVMLAPAVLFIVLSGEREALLNVRHFLALALFFVFALCIYLYLPIRTGAGAAIHWGDPDTLDRFLAHVSGRSHRHGYVLNKTPLEYLVRTKEVLWFIWSQFGVILLLSLWGWLKLVSVRWRVFFVLVIVFDFIYTIFLNIISLEITTFSLPTGIVISMLAGVGIAHILRAIEDFPGIGRGTQRVIRAGCYMVPAIPLFLNFGLCDQSRNYSAYEHAVNIFRTVDRDDILLMNGDNYVFPVTYGRIVERMREDVALYDRGNIIFKMPDAGPYKRPRTIAWEEMRNKMEMRIIEQKGERSVFYAVFGPYSIKVPDQYRLIPYGILHRMVDKDTLIDRYKVSDLWKYYATESFYDNFEMDFMNREMCAYFYFSRGKDMFLLGEESLGLKNMKLSSQIGYDDTLIHSDMAVFFTDKGFFKEARQELEKALVYHEDLSGVHNNWGYYFHKTGDYKAAIASFRKAVELKPDRFGFYNNLGFALYEAGRKEESLVAFQKSINLNNNQPDINKFIKEHYLEQDTGE